MVDSEQFGVTIGKMAGDLGADGIIVFEKKSVKNMRITIFSHVAPKIYEKEQFPMIKTKAKGFISGCNSIRSALLKKKLIEPSARYIFVSDLFDRQQMVYF